jgi:hypothetical protein
MKNRAFIIPGIIVAAVIVMSVLQSASAQTSQPTATPSSIPTDPVPGLQNTVATQQAQINHLNDQLTDEQRDRTYYDRDLQWRWGISAALGTAFLVMLTWVGLRSIQDLQKNWERRSQTVLDKAVYRLDLGNLPIHLPEGENLENIHRLLQLRKFEKISFYRSFDEFDRGVWIISLKDKDDKQRAFLLDKFTDFLNAQNPSPANTGFILYAPSGIKVPPEIMDCHDNLVTANYPATVVSMIFVVGRGIEIVPPLS